MSIVPKTKILWRLAAPFCATCAKPARQILTKRQIAIMLTQYEDTMKTRAWFEVGVRLIGVWLLYGALTNWIGAFTIQLHFVAMQNCSPLGYLVYGMGDFLFGLYLLLGARHLSFMAFHFRAWLEIIKTGVRRARARADSSPEQ